MVKDETICVAGFPHILTEEEPGAEDQIGQEVSGQEFAERVEAQPEGQQDGEEEAAPYTLHLHLHLHLLLLSTEEGWGVPVPGLQARPGEALQADNLDKSGISGKISSGESSRQLKVNANSSHYKHEI